MWLRRLLVRFRFLAIIISANILVIPIIVQAGETKLVKLQQQDQQQDPEQAEDFGAICMQAEFDAEKDEEGAIGYGFAGFLCGIFGWLFAHASSPKVPAKRLVGKSQNYVEAYSSCYEKKAKKIRTSAACTGWLVGASVGLLIFTISSAQALESSSSEF